MPANTQQELKQGQNIIAYYGKSWSEQESKQHILNLEAKALYLAIRKFQYELTLYSKEPKTIIYNDNRNLVNILNKKELPLHKMIANIFLELLGLNIEIKYIPTKENSVADAISRVRVSEIRIESVLEKKKRKRQRKRYKPY
jgi:RNase H-like domain found in reverse transcriptase